MVYRALRTTTKLTYHLKAKPKEDQFWISSPIGGTHFPGASQWAVIAKWTQEYSRQKCTLKCKCNKCCKWICCSVMPITHHLSQPGMVLLPRWTNLQNDSPNQRPTKIYRIAAKMYVMTKMPRQHTLRAIKPQFNNIYWCEIKEIE